MGVQLGSGPSRQLDERPRAVAQMLPHKLGELHFPQEADALAVLPLGVREAAREGQGSHGWLRKPVGRAERPRVRSAQTAVNRERARGKRKRTSGAVCDGQVRG